ncbi:MAG: aldehyde dehydrogenase family protein [Gemmatimonadaceae bacterium]|nr:aldehyde dehydrogenase family protein [Gemmatimonadaceae bacterium]
MATVAEIFQTMEYGPAPEADGPARAWLTQHGGRFGHFIGGQFTKVGTTFDVIDPSTAQRLAQVTQGTTKDVDAAVAAARKALPAWKKLSGHARAKHLYALARMVQKHARLFAVVESLDNGKSIRETRDLDIPLVARHFYHHAGWAQLAATEFPGYEGVGVVGQIIPWNFPLLMLGWKIAPALAAGNTVVLKPAEFTPLTALLFAELASQAGLPDGVVNVITGDGRTGAALVEHPKVDKIAFTGSTDVGRIIRRATAGSGKKLSLELGGKSPFIVYEDADLDAAVEGVVDAIWFNQGQVCCAGSRLLVQEGIAERMIAKLKARMERLRVGKPLDKTVDMGAIVAPDQLDRIRTLVEKGRDEGAEVWQPSWAVPTQGYFYPPTLCTNVEPASTIAQIEIFGPVLVAMTFRTPEESVALANNTPFGLAASVWSENINLALDIAPKLKAGVVWINATNLFDASAGFGGYRESGFGREGGREGMYEYLKPTPTPGVVPVVPVVPAVAVVPAARSTPPHSGAVDRTAKLYIGGKQARPDATYMRPVYGPKGALVGEVGDGNRKDLRNAVEAAHAAWKGWSKATGHARAQILYYIGENLSARRDEFAARLRAMTGATAKVAGAEVDAAVSRFFTYASWADKYDGAVHNVPIRGVALAMHEPIGVVGVACPDEAPLLGFVSLVAPLIATGNCVVAVPSERWPLAATDLYQVFDTSDVPGGVINIVTGARDPLALVLAEHDDVEGLWYRGSHAGATAVERASAANMKRTWARWTPSDWARPEAEGREFLREAVQVKNIWIPYGE